MDIVWIVGGALIYGLFLMLFYRIGKTDGKIEGRWEELHKKEILPPKKHKPAPLTEEEKAAIERQRRIDEFRG